jgi:hypothetical protein
MTPAPFFLKWGEILYYSFDDTRMTSFVSIDSDFVKMLDEHIEATEQITATTETKVEEFIHTDEHQAQTTTTSLEQELCGEEEEIICNDTYDEYNEAEYWDAVDYDSDDRYYY